ncbi:hypothetical protein ABT373_40160 [Streptomyces sp. NPDC000070]|uniref:hypothetical protein n=1 Tax=Streptomyces sp. NPDC000070 TaxID=3154240 RepID=UPI00331FC0AC
MWRKPLIITGIAAAVLGAGTYAMSGTESTTGLDSHTAVTVDGHKALSGVIVGLRTQGKYHPLPWVGSEVSGVGCPDLKAVAGTKVTCTGKADGKQIKIPVSVVKAGDKSITWKFER